ncbi:orc1/cdc6 family replication initiation protein [archaeon]|nr:orc1/cdc6 family replication initiation protein [archaeon]
MSSNIFSQYLQKENIFKNKNCLTASFVPGKIRHREQEIQQLSAVLAPVLKGYYPNNVFIYGTCGTGKTISARFVASQLMSISSENKQKIKIIYVNCKMKKIADTEYRIVAQLLKELGEHVPDTGLPTNVLYRKFFERVEKIGCTVIIMLDEIDTLIKKVGDEFLYNFTRINQEMKNSHITIVGITNDLTLRNNFDLRVKSSLSEEEILFKPYNATQLKDILMERVSQGFMPNTVDDTALNKCAALAAQEHGDARRALDLLRVAGEMAERMAVMVVTENHVDMAEQKIDIDRVTETIKAQPMQSQAVLYSIIKVAEKLKSQKTWTDKRIFTGDVFENYISICEKNGIKPLTQRRVSDLIGELDMLSIIAAKVISKGRGGRTREIILMITGNILERVTGFLIDRFEE